MRVTRANARGIRHNMRNGILFDDTAKQVCMWASCINGHIIASMCLGFPWHRRRILEINFIILHFSQISATRIEFSMLLIASSICIAQFEIKHVVDVATATCAKNVATSFLETNIREN